MQDVEGQFFLSIPPDAEDLAELELTSWCQEHPLNITSKLHGGIEFTAPLTVGFSLNRVLKIPNRILLRIQHFKTTAFKDFEKKLLQVRWGDFIGTGEIKFKVSSYKSRIYHKKNIENLALHAYQEYRKGQPSGHKDSGHSQTFYIQFNNDICNISVDTSGEHLRKRGYKKMSTDAPLRETIASTLLYFLHEEVHVDFNEYHLVDPFCGSGSFFTEAFYLRKSIAEFRSFSFEGFRLFRKINQDTELLPSWQDEFLTYNGFDENADAIRACSENCKKIPHINLQQKDVFDYSDSPYPSIIITNPPYGARLKGIDLNRALEFMKKNYRPKWMCLYLAKSQGKPKCSDYKLTHRLSFKNTKIPAHFLVYKENR